MVSAYIAFYLFLAGTGGGAFVFGSTVDLALRLKPLASSKRLSQAAVVTDAGLVIGPILIAASALFLLLDLGVPDRAFLLFRQATPSLLSLGAWAIALFGGLSLLSLVLSLFLDGAQTPSSDGFVFTLLRAAETIASIIATILAGFIIVYSGGFLAAYPALPFLHTPLLPILFTASSLATGLAALAVVAFFRHNSEGIRDTLRGLLSVDAFFIVTELIALAAVVLSAPLRSESATTSAMSLIAGDLSLPFWSLVIAGLAVPFALDILCRRNPSALLEASSAVCTLVGGLSLRFVLLMATQRLNLATLAVLPFWS